MRYKLFGKSGLKVSELCLGTMTFGTEWGPRGAEKEEAQKIFETFVEAGGNFFDTANFYTNGTSETFLGEFLGAEREKHVIASKYTLIEDASHINGSGNSRKNMMNTVHQSLKRLNTDYLDVLWLHAWDSTTPVEEVMRGLDDLVSAGKVLYIGVSDTPAWIVSKANTLAELKSWTQFIGLQVEYSLIQRTVERDLLPMAEHFGMSVTPWAPLGAGLLTGKYNEKVDEEGRLTENSVKYNDHNLAIARKVSEIAKEVEKSPAQVAINWLRQKGRNIIPILGARKSEQLADNLSCLEWSLTEEQMTALNDVSAISMGFPHDMLKMDTVIEYSSGGWRSKLDI